MRVQTRYKTHGWFNESWRHSLAAKGVKSKTRIVHFNNPQDKSKAALINAPGKQPVIATKDEGMIQVSTATDKDIQNLARNVASGQIDVAGTQEIQDVDVREPSERGRYRRATTPQRVAAEFEVQQIARRAARQPFEEQLSRLQAGNLTELDSALAQTSSKPFDRLLVSRAAFEGAQKNIDAGFPQDYNALTKAGLSNLQLEQLKRYQIERLGSKSIDDPRLKAKMFGEKAGAVGSRAGVAVLGGAEEATIEGVEAAGRGVKKAERAFADSPGFGSAESERIEKDSYLGTFEDEENVGVFNPIKIAGVDKILKAKQVEEQKSVQKRRAGSELSDRYVEEVYANRKDLSDVDYSAYDDGESAYRRGDREGVVEAITKLESENLKLKDRLGIIQAIRGKIRSKDNVEGNLAPEQEGLNFSNPIFSPGRGADNLARQTDMLAKTVADIQKSSNGAVGRANVLRRKLRKMDMYIPADTEVPQRDVDVFRKDSLLSGLDSAKGSLKFD